MDTLPTEHYYGSLPGLLRKYDQYARKNAFSGTTKQELTLWQRQTRELLWELLGLHMMEHCPLNPVLEETVRVPGGITREKLRVQVEPDVWMPLYILIPDNANANQRCYICPPGHQGAGKYSVAGLAEISAVKDAIARFNYDYGLQLAQQGHIALCPDARGFGERRDEALQTDSRQDFLNSTCFHLAHMAEPLGLTVAGLLTWDLMRLVDYVLWRGEWNPQGLSCLGFSGGGMQTLWLAALDTRIQLAVISGYMYGYKDSLLVLNGNCSCNYVPNLWKYMDMGDIAGLIAPRPLVVQSCREDHLNGARGLQNVTEQMDTIRHIYTVAGAPKRVAHDVCEGGHCWHEENIPNLVQEVLNG